MAEPMRVGPGFEPVWNAESRILLLGSFPSPKSREQGFYYGHPQNRFWPLLAALCGAPVPRTILEKRALVLANGFALWDTVRSCTITGASDASIRDAEPNDLAALFRAAPLLRVGCNGAVSCRMYSRYGQPQTGLAAVRLPSTSPANAAWSLPRLERAWREALQL